MAEKYGHFVILVVLARISSNHGCFVIFVDDPSLNPVKLTPRKKLKWFDFARL